MFLELITAVTTFPYFLTYEKNFEFVLNLVSSHFGGGGTCELQCRIGGTSNRPAKGVRWQGQGLTTTGPAGRTRHRRQRSIREGGGPTLGGECSLNIHRDEQTEVWPEGNPDRCVQLSEESRMYLPPTARVGKNMPEGKLLRDRWRTS